MLVLGVYGTSIRYERGTYGDDATGWNAKRASCKMWKVRYVDVSCDLTSDAISNRVHFSNMILRDPSYATPVIPLYPGM